MKLALPLALFTALLLHAQPEELLKQAISLHQSGNSEAAIPLYEKYLAAQPASLLAHSNLGAALARQGRFADAITHYRLALKLNPNNPPIELNLGLAYYKTNQMDPAAAIFEKVHLAAPAELQPKLLLANCWLALGQHKKVIALLTPESQNHSDDLAIAYMLGTALVRDNQPAAGQVIINRILGKGDSAEARLLLGTARLQAQEYPAALADLTQAVALNPNLPEVYSYYAQALLRTGDPVAAATAFRKALEANPNDYTANLQLAVLFIEEDKPAEAAPLLKRALLARPNDLTARYQQAVLTLKDESKTDLACRQLEQIVKESPQFTAAHVSLATVYYRLKRKADGDRERAIVRTLNAQAQAKQQAGVNVK